MKYQVVYVTLLTQFDAGGEKAEALDKFEIGIVEADHFTTDFDGLVCFWKGHGSSCPHCHKKIEMGASRDPFFIGNRTLVRAFNTDRIVSIEPVEQEPVDPEAGEGI